MKRRHFLHSLAAVAAAPAIASETTWKLNYMLASSMYGNLSLAEILPEVKKTGATGIELWPKKHGTQREELDAMGVEKFAAMLQAHAKQVARELGVEPTQTVRAMMEEIGEMIPKSTVNGAKGEGREE